MLAVSSSEPTIITLKFPRTVQISKPVGTVMCKYRSVLHSLQNIVVHNRDLRFVHCSQENIHDTQVVVKYVKLECVGEFISDYENLRPKRYLV